MRKTSVTGHHTLSAKAQQSYSNAKTADLGEIGGGVAGIAITTALLWTGAGELELLDWLHIGTSGALVPGPLAVVNGAGNLGQDYQNYLNQTANCTP